MEVAFGKPGSQKKPNYANRTQPNPTHWVTDTDPSGISDIYQGNFGSSEIWALMCCCLSLKQAYQVLVECDSKVVVAQPRTAEEAARPEVVARQEAAGPRQRRGLGWRCSHGRRKWRRRDHGRSRKQQVDDVLQNEEQKSMWRGGKMHTSATCGGGKNRLRKIEKKPNPSMDLIPCYE